MILYMLPCKIEKDQMKIYFLHYKSIGFFFRRSRAANSVVHGRISPNLELFQALMYIIITCKYEMNPIKKIRENVMTPFFPLYPYLFPWKPVVAFGRISNSFKLLYMFSVPANMKRIQSKISEKMARVL